MLAEVLHALPAGVAASTPPGSVDRHRLPDVPRRDARADGVDPSGVLVAEREGRLPRHHPGLEVVDEVQVGVAEAGSTHLHDDLTRAGVGLGHVLHLGLALPVDQAHCLHRDLPCR